MRFFLAAILFSFGLISCVHKQQPATPAKAVEQKTNSLMDADLVSSNAEKALGETIFTDFLHKYKLLEVSDDFKTYASDITKKIAENSHRPQVAYEVFFVDSKEFIAAGLPGGKILISKSFLNVIKTESEFANLIANQIAHIAKQHLLKNILKDSDYAAALKTETVNKRMQQQATFVLFELGFDIDMVNEADRLAPTYAMHVGYDTASLLSLLKSVQNVMVKTNTYGKTEYSYNLMTHRTSMNGVFVRGLEKMDRSGFPKAEDRFAAMMKKIKPAKKKKS